MVALVMASRQTLEEFAINEYHFASQRLRFSEFGLDGLFDFPLPGRPRLLGYDERMMTTTAAATSESDPRPPDMDPNWLL